MVWWVGGLIGCIVLLTGTSAGLLVLSEHCCLGCFDSLYLLSGIFFDQDDLPYEIYALVMANQNSGFLIFNLIGN